MKVSTNVSGILSPPMESDKTSHVGYPEALDKCQALDIIVDETVDAVLRDQLHVRTNLLPATGASGKSSIKSCFKVDLTTVSIDDAVPPPAVVTAKAVMHDQLDLQSQALLSKLVRPLARTNGLISKDGTIAECVICFTNLLVPADVDFAVLQKVRASGSYIADLVTCFYRW